MSKTSITRHNLVRNLVLLEEVVHRDNVLSLCVAGEGYKLICQENISTIRSANIDHVSGVIDCFLDRSTAQIVRLVSAAQRNNLAQLFLDKRRISILSLKYNVSWLKILEERNKRSNVALQENFTD